MSYIPRPLLVTPPSLVREGQFQLGTFDSPFREVNPLDADVSFGWLPGSCKRMRLKEWQHFALVNDEIYMSLALFDAKVLGLLQVCVYDRRQGKTIFHEKKLLPWQIPRLPGALGSATVGVRGRGFALDIANQLDDGRHQITFDMAATDGLPAVQGSFTCFEPLAEITPLVVCLPFAQGKAMYSHKCVVAAEGSLRLGGERIEFPRSRSYGLIDIHKGFYPFVMRWHWATAGQQQSDGPLLGFNLTNNQVEDQERYNENGLWVDGVLHLLPSVTFTNTSSMDLSPWSIRDAYGMVDLTFQPEVFRTVDLNYVLLESRYRGPFGTFSGTISDRDGHRYEVHNWFGMCENFYLRV